MRAACIAAPAPAVCREDGSDQQRVASAFVSAAIRLGPGLPAEPFGDFAASSACAVFDVPATAAYVGRHRRSIAVPAAAPVRQADPS